MKKLVTIFVLLLSIQTAKGQLAIVSFDPSHDGVANYDYINICNVGMATESLTGVRVRTYARTGTQNSDVLLSTLQASLDSGKCILLSRDGVPMCGTTSCDADGTTTDIPPTTTYNGNPATVHGTITSGITGDVQTGANFAQESYIALVTDTDGTPGPTSWIDLIKIDDSTLSGVFTLPTGAVAGDVDVTLDIPQGTVGGSNSTFVTRINVAGTGFDSTFRVANDSDAPSIVKTLASSPLAVSLLSATATISHNGIQLDWQTATETNNDRFEIEQKINGTWQSVGFVKGAGNSTSVQSYQFMVKNASVGLQSFRIKQVDFDGKVTYAKEITVLSELPGQVYLSQAYPNPFTQESRIDVAVAQAQALRVVLYNALGQEVATLFEGELATNEVRQVRVDASKLTAGTYFYRVLGQNSTELKSFVVSN